jgi:acyl-CoA synthetase (NDP forming)
MLVKAAPGVQVPKEGNPRDYITDADEAEVPETAYYMRRLMDGDLLVSVHVPPAVAEVLINPVLVDQAIKTASKKKD